MLVLDANILIRAVLETRVPMLLRKYAGQAEFFVPDYAFREASEHLPVILERRTMPIHTALETLDSLRKLLQIVELETYAPAEAVARQRLGHRDQDDWPILASALVLGHPIWTEDTDLFGCGVATWTTDRVELYLSELISNPMP